MKSRAQEDRITAACMRGIKLYGVQAQLRHLQEECGELIAAINHHARGRIARDELAGELADVFLCFRQAREILGCDLVDGAILRKLERFETRLTAAEAAPVDRFHVFTCPTCGGYTFGSHMLPNQTLERSCHGFLNEEPCTHRWNERDDHLYFHKETVLAVLTSEC